jgi:hypothetical protein
VVTMSAAAGYAELQAFLFKEMFPRIAAGAHADPAKRGAVVFCRIARPHGCCVWISICRAFGACMNIEWKAA